MEPKKASSVKGKSAESVLGHYTVPDSKHQYISTLPQVNGNLRQGKCENKKEEKQTL